MATPTVAVDVRTELDALRTRVEGIADDVRAIRELLERQQRRTGPLNQSDRAMLERMLPAVAGAYGPETFSARDLVEDDRPAVRLVVQERSAKQLGKLFSRADGIAIAGLMVRRQGLEDQVTGWRIVVC